MMAENKKTAVRAKKHTKLTRPVKKELDAKEICLGIKCSKQNNIDHCKSCKESGSLLYCSNCPNSYHLNCAKMKEADLPFGLWYCSKCASAQEKKLKDDYQKLEKQERSFRSGKLKEIASILANFEKEKFAHKFGKKYPQHVKQGKINYPIEDTLLLIDPEIHQVTLSQLPVPVLCSYPQDSFFDMISITVFVYTFSSLIGVSPFTIDVLYKELTKENESVLLKEIVMAITKELIVYILSKENLDEQLSGQSKFLYSAYKLSKVFNIYEFLPYSWLTLFSEIMTSSAFKEHAEDTLVECVISKFDEFPIESFFFQVLV